MATRSAQVRDALAIAMGALATAANVVLLVGFAATSLHLWGLAWQLVDNAGGLPQLQHFMSVLEAADKAAALQTLWARVFWWAQAWVAGTFAIGFGVLWIAGARWGWIRVRRTLL